tara:strand:+ start:1664 stop:1906 length:243 start_codon:yes stop_codon:yes gene_type:complete
MPLDQGAHDPTKPRYTRWRKVFAWKPRKLTNGKTVWLKFIYKRDIIIDWMPPAFPAKRYFNTQYADINAVIREKLGQKNR